MNNENRKIIEMEIAMWEADSGGQGGNAPLSVNASGVPRKNAHDRPPDMVRKIGKTTYKVWAHFSETSRETLDDKIKRMLRDDVWRMARSAVCVKFFRANICSPPPGADALPSLKGA